MQSVCKLNNCVNFTKKYKRPYILTKIGLSKDGKYCVKNKNVSITSIAQRKMSHEVRRKADAIMIGSETAVIDNPQLTVRYQNPQGLADAIQPLRVVIDSKGIVKSPNLMKFGTLIITSNDIDASVLNYWEKMNVKYEKMENIDLYEIMKILYEKYDIKYLLVEGGGILHKHLQNVDLIDEYMIYQSNNILPNGEIWPVDVSKFIDRKRVYSNINDAIEVFKNDFVIVMDDEFRENEGDLIIHPKNLTEEKMTFLKNNTTGIICVTIDENKALKMNLPLMVQNNNDSHKTAFTVSCDAVDVKSGVSSAERLKTINAIYNETEIRTPGHIFPLIARSGGLCERRGHTEAAIDLCNLSKIDKMSVICELTNEDGTMMKLNDVKKFADEYNIPVIHINQIIDKLKEENKNKYEYPVVKHEAECELNTNLHGQWMLHSFESIYGTHKVLEKKINNFNLPVVRIHSECFTGDVLHSSHCDCGQQLNKSMEIINDNGNGLIIFPANHEGRGIGFTNKVKAYSIIKDKNVDTYTANTMLNRDIDERNYDCCINILKYFEYTNKKFELLTNNNHKINTLLEASFDVQIRKLEIEPNVFNRKYIDVKKKHNENQYNITIIDPNNHKSSGELKKIFERNLPNFNVNITKWINNLKNNEILIGIDINEKSKFINSKNYTINKNIIMCYDKLDILYVSKINKIIDDYNKKWEIL